MKDANVDRASAFRNGPRILAIDVGGTGLPPHPLGVSVLVSGLHPILAKKARYYEDRRLPKRILSPPSLADLVKKLATARRDDWSALPPVAVDLKPGTGGSSDEDPDNAFAVSQTFSSMRRLHRNLRQCFSMAGLSAGSATGNPCSEYTRSR
jgi:hypothetical protein